VEAAIDLARVGGGFADPVLGSQAVFRECLTALARPGTIVHLPGAATPPGGLCRAAAAVALALLDQDTRVWLSRSLGASAPSLRFHTGCAVVSDPSTADFAIVAAPRELPPLAAFSAGTEEYPDRSTTVIVQVDALAPAGPWRLSGPGVRGKTSLEAAGLGDEFVREWAANRSRFPRGVDVLLAAGAQACGLPRTTAIEA
jgi:alpha-D-ribose 1-methylphosphonate 5-triphosphate synthase subunit PhnH